MNEHSSKDRYDDIFEAVLSAKYPEIDSTTKDQTESEIAPKFSGQKRQLNLDEKYTINVEKKKRKETTRDRLLDWNSFYTSKRFGIWIQCTKCRKWRKCLEYEEDHEIPKDWCCSMSKSGVIGCDDPENLDSDDFSPVDLIPGSIVWAKLDGYPWWPGMIEDDPDIEEFYWLSSGKCDYNVTFLDDKVSRAWVPSSFVRPFVHGPPCQRAYLNSKHRKYEQLIKVAKQKANDALTMPIKERFEKYSFAHTFKGKWSTALDFDSDEDEGSDIEMLMKAADDIESIKSFDSDYKSVSSEQKTKDDLSDSENSVECIQEISSKERNEIHKTKCNHVGHSDAKTMTKNNIQYKNVKEKSINENKTIEGKNKTVTTRDPNIKIKTNKDKDSVLKNKSNAKIVHSTGTKVLNNAKEIKRIKTTAKESGNQNEMKTTAGGSEMSVANKRSKLEFKPPIKHNEKIDRKFKFEEPHHETKSSTYKTCEGKGTEDEIKDAELLPNKNTISDYMHEKKTSVILNRAEKNAVKFKAKTDKNIRMNEISKQMKKDEEESDLSDTLEKSVKIRAFNAGNGTNRSTCANNNEKSTTKPKTQCRENGNQANATDGNASSLKFQQLNKNKGAKSAINHSKGDILVNTREIDSAIQDLKDEAQNSSNTQHATTKKGNAKNYSKNSQVANRDTQMPIKSCQAQKEKHEEKNDLLNVLEKNLKNQTIDDRNETNRSNCINNHEELISIPDSQCRENGIFQPMNKNEGKKSAICNSKRSIIRKTKEIDSLKQDLKDQAQNSSKSQNPNLKDKKAKKCSETSGKKSQIANADTHMPIESRQTQKEKHGDAVKKSNTFNVATKQKGTIKNDVESNLKNISYTTPNGTGGHLEDENDNGISLDEDMEDEGFSISINSIVQELEREDSPPFEAQL